MSEADRDIGRDRERDSERQRDRDASRMDSIKPKKHKRSVNFGITVVTAQMPTPRDSQTDTHVYTKATPPPYITRR